MLADMDTSAFNAVVSQPPSDVDAPIGWCCTGPLCTWVCIWVRVCMDEGDCMHVQVRVCTGVRVSGSVSVYRV